MPKAERTYNQQKCTDSTSCRRRGDTLSVPMDASRADLQHACVHAERGLTSIETLNHRMDAGRHTAGTHTSHHFTARPSSMRDDTV